MCSHSLFFFFVSPQFLHKLQQSQCSCQHVCPCPVRVMSRSANLSWTVSSLTFDKHLIGWLKVEYSICLYIAASRRVWSVSTPVHFHISLFTNHSLVMQNYILRPNWPSPGPILVVYLSYCTPYHATIVRVGQSCHWVKSIKLLKCHTT
jgi:hypothetical protein